MDRRIESYPDLYGPDADPYEWWRRAKADPTTIGTAALPIFEGEPRCGYFRVHRRDGPWEPVAIFRDEDTGLWNAERNGYAVEPGKINDLWIWCCRQPVEYEDWQAADSGAGWPDEPERAPGIGDNIKDADPREALMIEFLGELELVEEFLAEPIKTQADADRVAIWRDRLLKIGTKADAHHKVEKQPWLDGGRGVDERWRRLREEPARWSVKIRQALQAFFDEQDRLEKERVARAREEADRKKRIAELAAREAVQKAAAGDTQAMSNAGALVAAAKDAEAAAAYRNPSAGRTGALTKLVTRTSAAVLDWDALWHALKDREEVRELLQKLADKAAKAGVALPGTEIHKEKVPA